MAIAPEAARLLPRLGAVERAFVRGVARRRVNRLGELLVAWSISGTLARLGYMAEVVFPKAGVLANDHPGTRPWLRRPKRLARLAVSGLREGVNLLPLRRP